jgi:hypothetical protein
MRSNTRLAPNLWHRRRGPGAPNIVKRSGYRFALGKSHQTCFQIPSNLKVLAGADREQRSGRRLHNFADFSVKHDESSL